ncbi:MOXD1 like 1 [Pseudolycoriella hygida]|uniref:MOXD1 like 1 n=1 Tax=Pseudolycoriella hygida TaxID=35572 RepID=A0A9Q0N9W9_9DIPT|nr:MOXD1 like 1 [Pseudolycoriella hygida]
MQFATILIPLWIICGVESSSHDHRWLRTEVMDGNGLYILDWKIVEKEIVFRVTANTRGFIGLGFSLKSGKMSDADLVLAWVDDRTGKPTVLAHQLDTAIL